MTNGQSNQLIKQTGEYLVAAELCRRSFIATTFTGNLKYIDIIAIAGNWQTVLIQVKAIKGGSWQFNDARKYINIEIENGIQRVTGKVGLLYPNLVCIFVNMITQGGDEFYIFPESELQGIIYEHYRDYLERQKGIRPRNPNSTHCAISPEELKNFKDKWELLSTIAYR